MFGLGPDLGDLDLFSVATTLSYNETTTNATEDYVIPKGLYLTHQILTNILLMGVMFTMGAGLSKELVWEQLRRPIGPVLGMIGQFILLPALTFGIMMWVDFPDYIKIGAVITSSCPGGAYSNIWTYWSRGDLALSVTMTTLSTALAIVFMPLNVYIYTRPWVDEGPIVPFSSIAIAIAETWIFVGLGIACHYKFPRFSRVIVPVGSVFWFIVLVIDGIIQNACYPQLKDLGGMVWLVIFLMPLVAFTLAMILSAFFHRWLSLSQMKTIGYETGMQNMTLAFNIINLSFSPVSVAVQYSTYSLIYAMAEMTDFTVMSFITMTYYRCREGRSLCHQCADKCNHRTPMTDDPEIKDKRTFNDELEVTGDKTDGLNGDDVTVVTKSPYVSEGGLRGSYRRILTYHNTDLDLDLNKATEAYYSNGVNHM